MMFQAHIGNLTVLHKECRIIKLIIAIFIGRRPRQVKHHGGSIFSQLGKAFRLKLAIRNCGGFKHKVFRRIANDKLFRQNQNIGTVSLGPIISLARFFHIGVKITHMGVELCGRDFKLCCHEGGVARLTACGKMG